MGVVFCLLSKMHALVILSVAALSKGVPLPAEDKAPAAPVVLPYAFPGLLVYPYGVSVVPNILETGLHYPVAEAYVHDTAGDESDDASPAAEAYVHDGAGDVSDNSFPEAEAYVHDATGDA